MLSNFLAPIFYVLKLLIPAWVFYRLLRTGYQQYRNVYIDVKKEMLLFLFAAYIGCLVAVTIVPASIAGFNDPYAPRLNMVPIINTIKEYRQSLAKPDGIATRAALENIFGNLILFVPFGILLPVFFKKINSLKKLAAICFCCSLLIEIIQYFLQVFETYRTADIDDIILNTAGGMLGWLIYAKFIKRYFSGITMFVKKK